MNAKAIFAAFLLLLVTDFARAQDPCPTPPRASSPHAPVLPATPLVTQFISSTITVEILLVEFNDVKHRTSPSAYKRADFYDTFLSTGVYVTGTRRSPDNEAVYGSVADYYNKMSSGNLTLTGYVVNGTSGNDIPIWVNLPANKAEYDDYNYDFFTAVTQRAAAMGLDLHISELGTYRKLVIIYAGNTYWDNQLNPQAEYVGSDGRYFWTSERQGSPTRPRGDHSTDAFMRIGVSCHELAHLLGVGHATGSRMDIMDAGRRNGPNSDGSCGSAPAPMNPAHRAQLGWISVGVVSGQQPYDLYYSLTAPQVKKVSSNYGSDYFMFENRRFNQSMVIGTTSVPDYNNAAFFPAGGPHWTITQGVFAWKILGGNPTNYSNNGLIYASGRYGTTWPEGSPSEGDDGDPYPGVANVTVLSPWSDPRAPSSIFVPNTKYGTNVGMEVTGQNPVAGYVSVNIFATNPQDLSPSRPYGLQIGPNPGNNHVLLTWTANGEPDLALYDVWRIDANTGMVWHSIGTTTSTSYVDNDYYYSNPYGDFLVGYKIRAKDTQNKYSSFSDSVGARCEWLHKEFTGKEEVKDYSLAQNCPNPFNPSTTIRYGLPHKSTVHLTLFNTLGQQVAVLAQGEQEAGYHDVRFDGSGFASGVYIYRLQAGDFVQTLKLLLIR
jgi:M6 family metalloprotease-like protein